MTPTPTLNVNLDDQIRFTLQPYNVLNWQRFGKVVKGEAVIAWEEWGLLQIDEGGYNTNDAKLLQFLPFLTGAAQFAVYDRKSAVPVEEIDLTAISNVISGASRRIAMLPTENPKSSDWLDFRQLPNYEEMEFGHDDDLFPEIEDGSGETLQLAEPEEAVDINLVDAVFFQLDEKAYCIRDGILYVGKLLTTAQLSSILRRPVTLAPYHYAAPYPTPQQAAFDSPQALIAAYAEGWDGHPDLDDNEDLMRFGLGVLWYLVPLVTALFFDFQVAATIAIVFAIVSGLLLVRKLHSKLVLVSGILMAMLLIPAGLMLLLSSWNFILSAIIVAVVSLITVVVGGLMTVDTVDL